MESRMWLLVAVACIGWVSVQATDYCKFTPKHTMCKYSGRGPACGPEVGTNAVNPEDVATILDIHNTLRSKVAQGKEKRGNPGPQPSGANMRAMAWDEELAAVAQRHADQCVRFHDCNNCRQVDRFKVGQNWSSRSSFSNTRPDWNDVIQEWYDEVRFFPKTNIDPFQDTYNTGHYIQVVWADTYLIGCGYNIYQKDGLYTRLYVCNYGPAGHLHNGRRQMYRKGKPCRACPDGTSCSTKYAGLCA